MKSFAEHVIQADTDELAEYLVKEAQENPELFATFMELTYRSATPVARPVATPARSSLPMQNQPMPPDRQKMAALAQPVEDSMKAIYARILKKQTPAPANFQVLQGGIEKLFSFINSSRIDPAVKQQLMKAKHYLDAYSDNVEFMSTQGDLDLDKDSTWSHHPGGWRAAMGGTNRPSLVKNYERVYTSMSSLVQTWNTFKQNVKNMMRPAHLR